MTTNTFEQALLVFQAASAGFPDGGAKAIDAVLAPVMLHHDRRCIGVFLLCLDDAAQEDAGMFSLIHAAESFDDDSYVSELLDLLPRLWESAPKWTSILLMRSLNNESTKDVMVRKLREAGPEVKQAAALLCEKINARSPSFLRKTLPILLAAK